MVPALAMARADPAVLLCEDATPHGSGASSTFLFSAVPTRMHENHAIKTRINYKLTSSAIWTHLSKERTEWRAAATMKSSIYPEVLAAILPGATVDLEAEVINLLEYMKIHGECSRVALYECKAPATIKIIKIMNYSLIKHNQRTRELS